MVDCSNITIERINAKLENNVRDIINVTNTTDDQDQTDYDGYGAMQFIIITVTVYAAMGVFCTLISNIKRKPAKHNQATQDEAVLKYLRQEKSLKLQGFHMQLQTLRSKYTEMVRQYEEKMKLLEIRKELESMDSSPPLKPARHTRRLSLFTLHQGIKDKFSSKKRPSVDQTLGRMGFSLLHLMNQQRQTSDLQEEDESNDSMSDMTKSNNSMSDVAKSDKGASTAAVGESIKRGPETCTVDIETYKPSDRVTGLETALETDTLLPPVTSHLSESV